MSKDTISAFFKRRVVVVSLNLLMVWPSYFSKISEGVLSTASISFPSRASLSE